MMTPYNCVFGKPYCAKPASRSISQLPGDSALALMRTEPLASGIGVVITDHLMPGLSGAALSRELRKINNDVPIIVLSGLPDAGTEYDALNVAFLQKPFPPHELIQLVHKIAVARAA